MRERGVFGWCSEVLVMLFIEGVKVVGGIGWGGRELGVKCCLC